MEKHFEFSHVETAEAERISGVPGAVQRQWRAAHLLKRLPRGTRSNDPARYDIIEMAKMVFARHAVHLIGSDLTKKLAPLAANAIAFAALLQPGALVGIHDDTDDDAAVMAAVEALMSRTPRGEQVLPHPLSAHKLSVFADRTSDWFGPDTPKEKVLAIAADPVKAGSVVNFDCDKMGHWLAIGMRTAGAWPLCWMGAFDITVHPDKADTAPLPLIYARQEARQRVGAQSRSPEGLATART